MEPEENSPEISPTLSALEKEYSFIDASSDEDEEIYDKLISNGLKKSASTISGTPLNIELAQLLKTDVIDDVETFGISKNIETLERSTTELEVYEQKLQNSANFTKGGELFLRMEDDLKSSSLKSSDRTPCCSCKTSPEAYTEENQEQVYESGDYMMNSPLNQFNFLEPNTSFHSVNGYDNEQVMFEGIVLSFNYTLN